jgi:hypothetical protein
MRKHLIGLTVLLLCATIAAGPAGATGRGFGFHRPFFHGPGFNNRFNHGFGRRPFFFHHDRFFHPFFGFGFGFPYFGYPPYYAAYPYYGYGCQQVQSTILIYGQPQPAYVLACPQPDGTWRLAP